MPCNIVKNTCPACYSEIAFSSELAGKTGKCPECKITNYLPNSTQVLEIESKLLPCILNKTDEASIIKAKRMKRISRGLALRNFLIIPTAFIAFIKVLMFIIEYFQ